MKELIVKGNNIELRLEVGTARGRWYIQENGKIGLSAKTSWDLAELMKHKEEIIKSI